MLEDLKIMNKETLKENFGINKPGHLDKLYKAIQKSSTRAKINPGNQCHKKDSTFRSSIVNPKPKLSQRTTMRTQS